MAIEESIRAILSFGPRAVGTAAERATADYIAQQFANMTLNVSRQEFSTSWLPLAMIGKVLPAISIIFLYIVSRIFFDRPGVSFLLLLIPPALMWITLRAGVTFWSRWVRPRHVVTTANIIGETSPASSPMPTLVLAAHYDSKSQSQPLAPRILCVILPLLVYIVLVAISVLAMLQVSLPRILVMSLIAVAVICHLAYLLSVSSNRSPGAIDNASGVGILLDLASRLPERMKDRVRLVFLASGAEELGLVGASKYVEAYRDQLDPARTQVINFDSLGAGGSILLVTSGQMQNPELRETAKALFEKQGFAFRHFSFMLGAGMDHIPFARAGIPALSFNQGPLRAGKHIHSSRDRLEALNLKELESISRTVEAFIERIYDVSRES